MRRVFGIFGAALLFCQIMFPGRAGAENAPDRADTRRLLLVYSYNPEHMLLFELSAGFFDTLSTSGNLFEIDQLEFDYLRDDRPEALAARLAPFLPDIRSGKYQAIVTFNGPALDMLGAIAAEIPEQTALIFGGVGHIDPDIRARHANTTGVLKATGARENLLLGLKLFPDTRNVLFLTNQAISGRLVKDDLEQALSVIPGIRLTVLTRQDCDNETMLDTVARLPKGSLIIYHSWYDPKLESMDLRQKILTEISGRTTVPILVMHDALVRFGVLGGVVSRGELVGMETAELVLKVVRGEAAAAIPYVRVPEETLINWKMLDFYRLKRVDFPPGTVFVGRPFDFYETYRREIWWGGAGAVLILSGLTALAVLLWRRRRELQRRAILYRHLPLRFFVVDWDGNILSYELGDKNNVPDELRDFRHVRQLIGIQGDHVLEKVRGVLSGGRPITLDFDFHGERRTATISRLPRQLYHRETAIWVSQNTTELQMSRQAAAAMTERLECVFASIGEAVMVADTGGGVTMLNVEASRLTGWEMVEARGLQGAIVFSVTDAFGQAVESPVATVFRTMKRMELAPGTRLVARGGRQEYRIAGSASPILARDGHCLGAVLVFRDVTAEVERRNRDDAMHQLWFAVLEHLPLGVAVADADNDFRLLLANHRFAGLTGLSPADLIGRRSEALPFHAAGGAIFPDGEVMRSDRLAGFMVELPGATPDASPRLLRVIKFPLHLADGRRLLGITCSESGAESVRECDGKQWQGRTQKLLSGGGILTALCDRLLRGGDWSDGTEQLLLRLLSEFGGRWIIWGCYGASGQIRTECAWLAPAEGARPEKIPAETCDLLWARLPRDCAGGNEVLLGADDSELRRFLKLTGSAGLAAVPVGGVAGVQGILGLGWEDELWRPGEEEWQLLRLFGRILALGRLCGNCRTPDGGLAADIPALFGQIVVPLWIFDSHGVVVRANAAARELAADIPEQALSAPAVRAARERRNVSEEVRGRERVVRISAQPLAFGDAAPPMAVQSADDVTELVHCRDEQAATLRRLREAEHNRSAFLASMNHEIRTPLNSMIGLSELLRQPDVSAAVREEYLRALQDAGQTLQQLLNDLLDLARLESGRMVLSRAPVDPGAIAHEVAAAMRPQAEAGHLEFQLELPEAMPMLLLDGARLRQILLHLVGNAVRFTAQGTVGLNLSCELLPDEPAVRLTLKVSDTGCGIPLEEQKRLFRAFGRLQDIHGSSRRGAGLGLALVRRLVAQMGGRIGLDSAPGRGSTFTVILDRVELSPSSTAAPPESAAVASPLRVLAVDDVSINLRVLCAMLARLNVAAVPAESGQEALALLEKETFDLVMTDLWMPEMSGADLAGVIRANPAWAGLPLIAVTADVESGKTFDLRQFNGIVLKPVTLSKLEHLFSELRCGALRDGGNCGVLD